MTRFHDAISPVLPEDGTAGALAGRVWRPDLGGPSVVAIRAEGVIDISRNFPTMRDLAEAADPATALRAVLAWSRLHGFVSLEIAGDYASMNIDPDQLFEIQLATLTA